MKRSIEIRFHRYPIRLLPTPSVIDVMENEVTAFFRSIKINIDDPIDATIGRDSAV